MSRAPSGPFPENARNRIPRRGRAGCAILVPLGVHDPLHVIATATSAPIATATSALAGLCGGLGIPSGGGLENCQETGQAYGSHETERKYM